MRKGLFFIQNHLVENGVEFIVCLVGGEVKFGGCFLYQVVVLDNLVDVCLKLELILDIFGQLADCLEDMLVKLKLFLLFCLDLLIC